MENDRVFYDIWEINGQDVSLFKSSFDQGRAESSSLVLHLTKWDGASSNGVNLSVKTKIIYFMAPNPAPGRLSVWNMKIPTPIAPLKGVRERDGGGRGRDGLRDPSRAKYPKQAASFVPIQFNDLKTPGTRLVNYSKLLPAT